MLTGHLPHTSRSKQALACSENVEPGQELARTSCPAYSALPSPPPIAPLAPGARGPGWPRPTPSLVFQEHYRKDCNLAAQLLQCSQNHCRVHKLSEVTCPLPTTRPAPSQDHPAPFGPPHPEASPHPPRRSYPVSLNPRPWCTWVLAFLMVKGAPPPHTHTLHSPGPP